MLVIDGQDHRYLGGKYTALGTQQMDLGTSGTPAISKQKVTYGTCQ